MNGISMKTVKGWTENAERRGRVQTVPAKQINIFFKPLKAKQATSTQIQFLQGREKEP